MAPLAAFPHADRSQLLASHNVVKDCADAADGETEDQALKIKSGSLRQIEEAGRISSSAARKAVPLTRTASSTRSPTP
jgi:hypothetical protein